MQIGQEQEAELDQLCWSSGRVVLVRFSLQDGAVSISAFVEAFLLPVLGRALLAKAGELCFGVVTRPVCPGNGEVGALPVLPV